MNKTFVAAATWSTSLGATLAGQTTVPAEKAAWAVYDISLHAIQCTQDHQHLNERAKKEWAFHNPRRALANSQILALSN
jgi:hypothetical protein